jgi:APA family basic amino acid/polyamine antiporter
VRPATVATGNDPASPDRDLIQAIGLGSAILFVLGSVIGSGIFLTTGMMAVSLPSTSLLLLAWTAGGVLAITGGLTYAEMGAMFPRSGGVYVFLREAYGTLPAFLYGWVALLVVFSGGLAAVSVGFAEYLSYFFPVLSPSIVVYAFELGGIRLTVSSGQLVAAGTIAVIGAINYVGVRRGNAVNVILTAAKVAGLAALPIVAIVAARTTPVLIPVVPPGLTSPAAGFGVAMIAVLWTYEAWYFVTFAAGEIRNPHRNVPRALVAGLLLLMAIYVIVNLSYFYALTLDEVRGVTRIAERAATAMVGPRGATFVALTVVVSTFGNNVAALLAGSRLLFAMAADGVFFPTCRRVHPRYRTPHIAIVALTVWSAVLALSGTYEQLFTYVMFASILFSVAAGAAVFKLRRDRPDHPRPYRTFGYPVVPLVFIGGSTAFVVNTLFQRPVESMVGLGLLLLGVPAYWHWRKA